MSGSGKNLVAAHYPVIDTRLDALNWAIRSGDQDQVKFQFDRVRRAVDKLGREAGVAQATKWVEL